MKAIIFTLLVLGCVYAESTDFSAKYAVVANEVNTCCYPKMLNIKKVDSTGTLTIYWDDSTACTGEGLDANEIQITTGTITGTTMTYQVDGSSYTVILDSDLTTGTINLPPGGSCVASLVKSGYLASLGALVLLSFSYLMF